MLVHFQRFVAGTESPGLLVIPSSRSVAAAIEGARALGLDALGYPSVESGRRSEGLGVTNGPQGAGQFQHLANFGTAFLTGFQVCCEFPRTRRAGEVLTVEEATDRGAAEWLPLLNPGAADRLNQARTPERRQLDHERAPVD